MGGDCNVHLEKLLLLTSCFTCITFVSRTFDGRERNLGLNEMENHLMRFLVRSYFGGFKRIIINTVSSLGFFFSSFFLEFSCKLSLLKIFVGCFFFLGIKAGGGIRISSVAHSLLGRSPLRQDAFLCEAKRCDVFVAGEVYIRLRMKYFPVA